MGKREDIQGILLSLKACLMLGRFSVMDRAKNRQGLIDLGIGANERREELLVLVPEDYVAGPKPDDTDDTKQVWEFGRRVNGKDVYIKFRIVPDPRNKRVHWATIWSFHPAEYAMKYPLKGGEV